MLEARILTGNRTGTVIPINRFPFSFGRQGADCVLADPGVWDRHFTISLGPDRAFELVCTESAVISSDQRTFANLCLRNGEIVEMGAVRIEFRLSRTSPRPGRLAEGILWGSLGLVVLAELALVLMAL